MDEKGQFLSLHASYLPIQVLKTSLVARCQGHNVVGAKGVRSNLVFSTLSFLPFAHPRRFFNVTIFGNFMPN
jgi:hypothetical protein